MTTEGRRAIALAAVVAMLAAPVPASAGAIGDATVELAEFVAGRPLDDASRSKLIRLADEDASANPEKAARSATELQAALKTIRALPDEPARAKARQAIATRLYWDAAEKPDPVSSLTLDKVGVVAADRETRAVVRRVDLDGVCRSARLAAEMIDAAFDRAACFGEVERTARSLASLAPSERELLAAGERRAATLAASWNALDADARASLSAATKQKAGSVDPVRLGRALETVAISAALDARLKRYGDAQGRALTDGAVLSAIRGGRSGM